MQKHPSFSAESLRDRDHHGNLSQASWQSDQKEECMFFLMSRFRFAQKTQIRRCTQDSRDVNELIFKWAWQKSFCSLDSWHVLVAHLGSRHNVDVWLHNETTTQVLAQGLSLHIRSVFNFGKPFRFKSVSLFCVRLCGSCTFFSAGWTLANAALIGDIWMDS